MESIADFLGIDTALFEATGAFNAILGVDSRLFVDPPLVYSSNIDEFKDAQTKVHTMFNNIMRLVRASSCKGDRHWRNAVKLITMPEVKGISIGYPATRANGNAIGRKLAEKIINDAHEINQSAKNDKYFFELLGLFEENVGADRISDIVLKILEEEFIEYSKRIFSDLGLNYDEDAKLDTGENIILVPKGFLSDLPHYDHTFRNEISDELVRSHFNSGIGSSWKDAFSNDEGKYSKEDVLKEFSKNPEVFEAFVKDYSNRIPVAYNFQADPQGEVIWYEETKAIILDQGSDFDDYLNDLKSEKKSVLEKARLMCAMFKDLVENNKLSSLLYKDDYADAKNESAVQLLFYGVCYFFCQMHDIDLTPESNTGRGPVDFKTSQGSEKVLIEVKKTLHSKLEHGYFTQLEEYKRSEKARDGIFLVIILEGERSEKNLQKFKNLIANKKRSDLKSDIVYVDARKKKSASK